MVGRKLLYLFLLYMVLVYNALYQTYDGYVLLIVTITVPVISLAILIAQKCFISIRRKENYITRVRAEMDPDEYEVHNPTPFPVPYAEAVLNTEKEKIPFSVPARNKVIVSNPVCHEHCGVSISQLRCMYIYDFFNLFRFKIYNPGVVKVIIMPRLYGVREGSQKIISGQGGSNTSNQKGDDRSEIFEIREYRDGDSIRDIHQKLSARMSRQMVKVYSCEDSEQPTFLLWLDENSNEPGEINDRMIEAMYAVMNALLAQGQFINGIIPEKEGLVSVSINNKDELDSFFERILSTENFAAYVPWREIKGLHIFAVSRSEDLIEFMDEMCRFGEKPVLYIPKEEYGFGAEDSVVCVSLSGGEQICFD